MVAMRSSCAKNIPGFQSTNMEILHNLSISQHAVILQIYMKEEHGIETTLKYHLPFKEEIKNFSVPQS